MSAATTPDGPSTEVQCPGGKRETKEHTNYTRKGTKSPATASRHADVNLASAFYRLRKAWYDHDSPQHARAETHLET